jgi:hypothetical protein
MLQAASPLQAAPTFSPNLTSLDSGEMHGNNGAGRPTSHYCTTVDVASLHDASYSPPLYQIN